jgi:hypothetical protein
VSELLAEDGAVTTIPGTDVDTSDADSTVKFEIAAGNDDGMFAIGETTGDITMVSAKGLDFEDVDKYTLTIRTIDGNNADLYNDENFDVNIVDKNEPPEIDMDEDDDGKSTGGIERAVTEKKGEGSKVGEVISCSDVDENDKADDGGCTATCKITDHLATKGGARVSAGGGASACRMESESDVGCFTMDGYQIKVADAKEVPTYASADTETQTIWVRVVCTDEAGDTDTQDVEIAIEEFNEEPTIKSIDLWIFENTPKGTLIGDPDDFEAEDEEVEDGTQTLTWSITKGNGDDYFKIDGNTGQLSMNKDNIDYEDRADDDGVAKIAITITVEDDDPKNPKAADSEVKVYILDVNAARQV